MIPSGVILRTALNEIQAQMTWLRASLFVLIDSMVGEKVGRNAVFVEVELTELSSAAGAFAATSSSSESDSSLSSS